MKRALRCLAPQMWRWPVVPLLCALLLPVVGHADRVADATNPIKKVLDMIGKLEQEIIHEGEDRHKAYTEFSDMCKERSTELMHENKLASAQMEDLKASIDKAADDESELSTQIEELSSVLSTAEADLKAATKIRAKEKENFKEDEKDLVDTVGQMQRAIAILEKQMKGGAVLLDMPKSVAKAQKVVQLQRAQDLVVALSAIVEASSLAAADTSTLRALLQTDDEDSDEQDEKHFESSEGTDSFAQLREKLSGDGAAGIVETLQGLMEKSETQLETARSKESKSAHNFELFKASLERKIASSSKAMNEAKKEKAEAGAARATAEGNLETTKADLTEGKKALEELHHECMSKATDFEEETEARGEELKALATAKKVIKETTGGSEEEEGDFAQVSFLQVKFGDSAVSFLQVKSGDSAVQTDMLASQKAIAFLQRSGKQHSLPELLELASKVGDLVRNSALSGEDPFAKVKGMLSTMLSRLQKEMDNEASQKAYCDKEMGDTKKSKHEKESTVEKLQTRVDSQTSSSMDLKEQVAEFQKELLALMKTQAQVDQMRQKEHALYLQVKPELEQGLEGVQKALKVLRDYYSQDDDEEGGGNKKEGAGTNIINMLEVVESDITKNLSGVEEEESNAKSVYEAQTKENNIVKVTKEKEIEVKTAEAKAIDKSTSETSADLDGVSTELDAVNEYFAKIQERCVAKPEPYEERRKRQEQTLAGLKDALQTLQGSGAASAGSFLQPPRARRLRRALPE